MFMAPSVRLGGVNMLLQGGVRRREPRLDFAGAVPRIASGAWVGSAIPFILARRKGSDIRLCWKVANPSRMDRNSCLRGISRLDARGLAVDCAHRRRTWYDMPAAIVGFFSTPCLIGLPTRHEPIWAHDLSHSLPSPCVSSLPAVAVPQVTYSQGTVRRMAAV